MNKKLTRFICNFHVVCPLQVSVLDLLFLTFESVILSCCRHRTFWKIGICYAIANGVCDEWSSMIEPIMSNALQVSSYDVLNVLITRAYPH